MGCSTATKWTVITSDGLEDVTQATCYFVFPSGYSRFMLLWFVDIQRPFSEPFSVTATWWKRTNIMKTYTVIGYLIASKLPPSYRGGLEGLNPTLWAVRKGWKAPKSGTQTIIFSNFKIPLVLLTYFSVTYSIECKLTKFWTCFLFWRLVPWRCHVQNQWQIQNTQFLKKNNDASTCFTCQNYYPW